MKNILFLFFNCLVVFFIISCANASPSDPVDPPDPIDYKTLKLVIKNNTEYDIKKIYYSSQKPSYNNYGEELDASKLNENGEIVVCPSSGSYYFTFIRQNGSSSNNLHISSKNSLALKDRGGIFTVNLLPYNFTYQNNINEDDNCQDGSLNGE